MEQIDNTHLAECSGLTLQEYSIRHHISLDLLVRESMVNVADDIRLYTLPAGPASTRANTILLALAAAQCLTKETDFVCLSSDIRRLDELLWYLRELQVFGFQFRQEYRYSSSSHRVVPVNRIKTLRSYEEKFPTLDVMPETAIDFKLFLSVIVARLGELRKGYVFFSLPACGSLDFLWQRLTNDYQIRWVKLDEGEDSILFRTESLQDAQRLLTLVEPCLKNIPCVRDRFYANVPQAMVSKELVFDSAHFITDHPGKCANLHGGRYTLNVKIKDRIDPLTGFVIDYGYLKSVVKRQVIERLDHQNLNFVCADLGWRSSTELLNIFIWEQLIDYLPGLVELKTYETTQSYCQYQGPSLEQMQNQKSKDDALKFFSQVSLGQSVLRQLLGSTSQDLNGLKIVKK